MEGYRIREERFKSEPQESIIHKITSGIADGRENALRAAFLRHGFTVDYVRLHRKEFRVDEKDNVRSYYHNGELLFDEIECIQYKPLKKSVNSVTNELAYRVMYVHY